MVKTKFGNCKRYTRYQRKLLNRLRYVEKYRRDWKKHPIHNKTKKGRQMIRSKLIIYTKEINQLKEQINEDINLNRLKGIQR